MKADQKLYFIAIVPPEPIKSEVFGLKERCAAEYNTRAALRSPPHITLHMPFKLNSDKVLFLQEKLNQRLNDFSVFKVALEDFGSFPPRVIFVRVNESSSLTELHGITKEVMRNEFHILSQDYKDGKFHPHMTIAFRDLRKSEYYRAWDKFKEEKYSSEFKCEEINLLEHNGKYWEIKSSIIFNKD